MSDVAAAKGMQVNAQALSAQLGCPVVPVVASAGTGLADLKTAIARAAAEGPDSPDEDEIARVYGTNSPGRIRRLLDHLEKKGLIVTREDFGGGRTITVPGVSAASVDG